MSYITKDDLRTQFYEENLDEIIRYSADDDPEQQAIAEALLADAIDAGISEAKGYLSKYDLLQLFGDDDTDPTVSDINLKEKVKCIIAWNLIHLANPAIDYQKYQDRYTMALDWLKGIQKGNIVPYGWPYQETITETPDGSNVTASYNDKRTNHY